MTATISLHPAPVDLRTARRHEYTALALMYVAQGLPAGLAFNALGVLIRQSGHTVADVGWTGLAFLPWALKFLWASAVDNFCARAGYGRVVGVTQALAVGLCLAISMFPVATHLHLALAGIVLLNAVCATQDIATNAYAVSRLQGKGAGPANAIQVAGFIGGMMAGGGGLLLVVEWLGWSGALQLLALLMAALYLPLWRNRAWRAREVADPAPPPARLRDIREHDDLGWALAIALCFKFASTAVGTLCQPWLIDRGLSLSQIGTLQMSNLLVTALSGFVIGVPMVRRLGNRRAVLVSCALAAAALGAAWMLNAAQVRDVRWFYLAFGLQSACEGAMFVAIWALFMNWASPRRPGTDYTTMQCCESLANAMAAGVVGGLGQSLGYGAAFAWVWAAGLGVLVFIALGLRRMVLNGEAQA